MHRVLKYAAFALPLTMQAAARPSCFDCTVEVRAEDPFEWTALGDSYASGVGSGNSLGYGRCLRTTGSYVSQLNAAPAGGRLPGSPNDRNLHYAACSGATTADVLAQQFRDTDGFDPMYGSRPKYGNPKMATLSVGGNDIDLLGIARSCILELFPPRSCEEQIKRSWSLIRSPDLANNIEKVISAAITKGRAGSAGDAFKLYVLGYADFYNVDTDQCSTVTFARNPKRDGSSQKMTKELRQTFNDMANELNGAIAEAVNRQGSQSAFYVDWQANGGLTGHRYCEEGVIEPDTNRADTWFWHWPYGTRAEEDALDNVLASIWDPSVSTLAEFDTKHGGNPPPMPDSLQDSNTFWNTVFDHSNNDTLGLEGALSNRVRVLHPTEPGHVHIRDSVLAQLVVDLAPAAPIVDPTPPVGACNTKYAILLDEVNIKGANWDEADFKNGDGLHDQMKGCGALTGWNFNANLVDPEYKWEATFNLPIGTKPCVQRAIVSAGGDPEKCSGTS